MTLISKLPDWPATVVGVVCAITWAQTMQTDSAITGLTLPGMIELPGWTAGRSISPIPARGPEPSQRISLAIFMRLTANVLSEPLASTMLSRVLCAWKWLLVSRTVTPVISESIWQTRAGNAGGVLTHEPAAVPPTPTQAGSGWLCPFGP